MVKVVKKAKTLIMPSLKEKKRFIVIRSKSDSFDTINKAIKVFFGMDNYAKAGIIYLKEFTVKKNKQNYFVIRINPKFIELLFRTLTFSKFKAYVDIPKIFGNVSKLELYLKNLDELTNYFDIIPVKSLSEVKKVKKIKYLYLSSSITNALKNKHLMTEINFVYAETVDELKKIDKINLPYYLNFSSYENIDLIQLYKSLKKKPFAIFSLETNKRSDFLRFRNSNMNQVVAKYFSKQKIFYGLNISLLSGKKNKEVILGRIYQNLELCQKYKVPIVIASFDFKNIKNMKNVTMGFDSFKINKLIFDNLLKV